MIKILSCLCFKIEACFLKFTLKIRGAHGSLTNVQRYADQKRLRTTAVKQPWLDCSISFIRLAWYRYYLVVSKANSTLMPSQQQALSGSNLSSSVLSVIDNNSTSWPSIAKNWDTLSSGDCHFSIVLNYHNRCMKKSGKRAGKIQEQIHC